MKQGSEFDYEYNLTDHLGNVRVTVDELGDIVQRDDYYPFGLTFNSMKGSPKNLYTYNGKEEQEESNWIDFGERMYDAALGRWQVIDRLAINYVAMSPYNYALNNPTRYVDPDGAAPWDVLQTAMNYRGTSYQWSGKNVYPGYVNGVPSNVNLNRITIGIKNDIKWSKRFYGPNYQMPIVEYSEIYRANGANIPEGFDCGLDCSGLATKAFNADPDKLMGNFEHYLGAEQQRDRFRNAEKEGIGRLHNNFNQIIMGDLVFQINNKNRAHHVMVATGKARYDSNGNVIEFQVIDSSGSRGVTSRWLKVDEDYFEIGHTKRINEASFNATHKSQGMNWLQFSSWMTMNGLWDKLK